jgi:hypothetical protein
MTNLVITRVAISHGCMGQQAICYYFNTPTPTRTQCHYDSKLYTAKKLLLSCSSKQIPC